MFWMRMHEVSSFTALFLEQLEHTLHTWTLQSTKQFAVHIISHRTSIAQDRRSDSSLSRRSRNIDSTRTMSDPPRSSFRSVTPNSFRTHWIHRSQCSFVTMLFISVPLSGTASFGTRSSCVTVRNYLSKPLHSLRRCSFCFAFNLHLTGP